MRLVDTRRIATITLAAMTCSMLISGAQAFAANSGDVVINEIAWAGSADSSSDEYIELYNPTSQEVDLSGWTIDDDDGASTYSITSGSIASNGYFLIEKNEDAVKSITADAVISLSLANSGDKLVLKDAAGNAIDTVNSSGGTWFAGNSTNKLSMERIDASVGGDVASNWASNTSGNGAVASGDSIIKGTPKGLNSVSTALPNTPKAELKISNDTPVNGDTVQVLAEISNVTDLFSYGFDVTYDSAVLKYVGAQKKDFLNESGSVVTSFQAGLENGAAGKVVVAEARTVDPKTTKSGDGELFVMEFEVIGFAGDTATVAIAGSSFMSDISSDISASFISDNLTVQSGGGGTTVDPVTSVTATESANRYELAINWQAPATGADSYKIYRKNVSGAFVELGTATGTSFVDKDGVNNGGKIIPDVDYSYKVVAVKGGQESSGVEVVGKETRGLKGDNNRSDRVDGRDLDGLAKHFGEVSSVSGFEALIDTTYDGNVDGSDLLDLTANWARTYVVS